MDYLWCFLCGGLLCAVGQVLIDLTKLTPARILSGYVVAGVILQAVGVYQPLVDWAGGWRYRAPDGVRLLAGQGRGKSGGGKGAAGRSRRRADRHRRRHRRGGGVRPYYGTFV